MNRRLIFDTDVKAVREEKLMGLRPEIYDEYDLIDAVPDADLSELWIPVEERVPEDEMTRVLVCLNNTNGLIGFPAVDTDRFWDGRWVRWEGAVTHWMPLPIPITTNKEDA